MPAGGEIMSELEEKLNRGRSIQMMLPPEIRGDGVEQMAQHSMIDPEYKAPK